MKKIVFIITFLIFNFSLMAADMTPIESKAKIEQLQQQVQQLEEKLKEQIEEQRLIREKELGTPQEDTQENATSQPQQSTEVNTPQEEEDEEISPELKIQKLQEKVQQLQSQVDLYEQARLQRKDVNQELSILQSEAKNQSKSQAKTQSQVQDKPAGSQYYFTSPSK